MPRWLDQTFLPANDEPLPEIPGFEIIAKLTSGGMGDILLAYRRSTHGFEKLFAVKTIRGDKLERRDIRAMFLDEARLLARLDHPQIAQVYDFGEVAGVLYLAMEYVAGVTFGALIRDTTIRLSPIVAARMMAEVCWGLHMAHELKGLDGQPLGVVHRDVSPVNLLITYTGGVKIIDFGIALMREREAPVTAVGVLKGKPSYMAPEQRHGDRPDRRTDVYAACIVLHELLTRQRLFCVESLRGQTLDEMAANILPPSAIAGPLPPGLDEIVMRGLAVDPNERFQDARALKIALESVIGDAGAGETLHAFAEKELAARREAHDLMLKSLLAGDLEPHVQVLEGDSVQPSRHTMSAVVERSLAGFEDSTNQTLTKLDPFPAATDPKEEDPFHTLTVPVPMPRFADDLAPPPAKQSEAGLVKSASLPFVGTQADPISTRAVPDLTGPRLRRPRARAFALGALLVALGAATYVLVHLVAEGTIFSGKPSPAVAALREEAQVPPAPIEAAADLASTRANAAAHVEAPTNPAVTREEAVEAKPPPRREEKPAEAPRLTHTEPPPSGPPSTPHASPKRSARRAHRAAQPAHEPPPTKRTIEKGLVTDW